MLKMKPGKRTLWPSLVVMLALLCLASIAYAQHLEALLWHFWAGQSPAAAQHLHLKDYVVEREAVVIRGVGQDLSDLSYNLETNTLFTVSNKQPLIVELSLQGEVLRKIEVQGVGDMEGITHLGGKRYALINEAEHSVVLVDLPDHAQRIDVRQAPRFTMALYERGNKGLEGVVWDQANKRLLMVKERSPKRLLSLQGFVDAIPKQSASIHIQQLRDAAYCALRDLSAISIDAASGNLLLLSDESRMVAEYDEAGNMLGSLALWRGFQGLSKSVPQAEGLALGPDKRLYVISEPNLLYEFKPGTQAQTANRSAI